MIFGLFWVFSLSLLKQSVISQELLSSGLNVCSETRKVTITVEVLVSYQVAQIYDVCCDWTCWSRCDRTRYLQAYRIEAQERSVDKLFLRCCDGYLQVGNQCPNSNCSIRCVHGRCEGPYNCVCESGYDGGNCERALPCASIPALTNGFASCLQGSTGDNCSFECNAGYTLIGSPQRTCQPNHEWNGTVASCQAVPCESIPVLTNGVASCLQGSTGDRCTFKCNDGYSLVGSSERVCQPNHKWNGTLAQCQALPCQSIPPLANGLASCLQGSTGDSCTFECNAGFSLIGSPLRVCQSNQQWSGTLASCQEESTNYMMQCYPVIEEENI